MLPKTLPFYTKDASLDDEVVVEIGIDGGLVFKSMKKPSENSTIRIVIFDNYVDKIKIVLESLEQFGCLWESMSKQFYSINVPGNINLDTVLDLFEQYTAQGWLDYESGMLR